MFDAPAAAGSFGNAKVDAYNQAQAQTQLYT